MYHFIDHGPVVRRQKLNAVLWPLLSKQWFEEDNNARNGISKKKQRKVETKMGKRRVDSYVDVQPKLHTKTVNLPAVISDGRQRF